jgi:hypothetical protein
MSVRALSLLIGVVALVGGCGGITSKAEGHRAFTVAVSGDAARVSREAGVELERIVADSAARVFMLLPHRGRIRIEVQLDASRSIPEVGVGGYTDPKDGNVFLWIDDSPPGGLAKSSPRTWCNSSG